MRLFQFCNAEPSEGQLKAGGLYSKHHLAADLSPAWIYAEPRIFLLTDRMVFS